MPLFPQLKIIYGWRYGCRCYHALAGVLPSKTPQLKIGTDGGTDAAVSNALAGVFSQKKLPREKTSMDAGFFPLAINPHYPYNKAETTYLRRRGFHGTKR